MLSGLAGARHPTWSDAGDGSGRGLVSVELQPDAADRALEALRRLEVPAADITLRAWYRSGLEPETVRARTSSGPTFSAGPASTRDPLLATSCSWASPR
jgi:hypothetical protein